VAELWLVAAAGCFSVFWVRFYTQGPLEWLWHCLVEWKWHPLPKQQSLPANEAIA